MLDGILGNVARRQHLGIIEESTISFADFAKEWESRAFPTEASKPRALVRNRGKAPQASLSWCVALNHVR